MSHELVKITDYDKFSDASIVDGYWHLISQVSVDKQVLCSGIYLDYGGIGFVSKAVKRGGITCPECLKIIKAYKAVQL